MSMLVLAIRRKIEISWMLKGRFVAAPFFLLREDAELALAKGLRNKHRSASLKAAATFARRLA